MVTISRAELTEIAWRYGMDYDISDDPTIGWVRGLAVLLRREAPSSATADALLAEAADLDALADRYAATGEQERA